MSGPIKSWSHSRLVLFDQCRRHAYLKHVERIPEPARPLPPGKSEHANDRGTRVHDGCERYVRGDDDYLPIEAEKHFGPQIDLLRVLYAEGKVSVEGEWGLDKKWEPTDYKTAWHRCKLDALLFVSPNEAICIDYKTGRKFGNEVKHGEQMQLYQLNAFMRYPKLDVVHTELWYLDIGEESRLSFTRLQGLKFKPNFNRRGLVITEATDFKPNPNKFSCRYCMYGQWGTGHCQVGVKE
jgi:hypothetical protein